MNEKYVFKYCLPDGSRWEGVVICLDGEKIDFRYSDIRVMIVFCFFDKIDNTFFIIFLIIHVANDTYKCFKIWEKVDMQLDEKL